MTNCLGKIFSFGLPCVSFRDCLSVCVCHSFTFGFEGDVIVLMSYHGLSFLRYNIIDS